MISQQQKNDEQRLYIRMISDDGCEHACTLHMNWLQQPFLRLDTNGNPTKVLEIFWADSWEEAMTYYHEVNGWEP